MRRAATTPLPQKVLRARVKPQQERWLVELRERFGHDCVTEWPAFVGKAAQYSPRLDLAVGPFSVKDGVQLACQYRKLEIDHHEFLEMLWNCHAKNEDALEASDDRSARNLDEVLSANRNARCFLAIEIENEVSRKHLMGGAVNATALGHIGILIGWTDAKVHAMFRVRRYLHFLQQVDKPVMPVKNLLIISREQAIATFALSKSMA